MNSVRQNFIEGVPDDPTVLTAVVDIHPVANGQAQYEQCET
jgi:hypothetical protein